MHGQYAALHAAVIHVNGVTLNSFGVREIDMHGSRVDVGCGGVVKMNNTYLA